MNVDDEDVRRTLDIVDRHVERSAERIKDGDAEQSMAHSMFAIALMLRVAFEDEFSNGKDELG